MDRVQLPEWFASRIKDTPLVAAVNTAVDRCCAFYGDPTRGLRFFPEFTDHGVKHIQGVLDATAELLTPEARELLTPQDVAVLTIGVLLHDAAMHLTADGFLALINCPEN